MLNKKLMILGASYGQLPTIKKAVEMGYYVITVDYLPINIGHEFSHQYVNCSTVDQECVLKFAEDLEIDGILTVASDVATKTVGYVTEALGLSGYSQRIAETMSNKANFRRFQRENGLIFPGFVTGRNWGEVQNEVDELSLPLMFKPVDTSGSRGITKVYNNDFDIYKKAFKNAQAYSRSKNVCVEEYIEGTEVGGDGFLVNGKIAFAAITHKHKKEHIPIGHALPTNISEEDQKRVLDELTSICCAAGYTDGPINFDVIVSPERVTALEMSPRLGGNGIPDIIFRGTGVDLKTATIQYALGERNEIPNGYDRIKECGSFVFGSDREGILTQIASEKELLALVPEAFDYFLNYLIGERIPEFQHSGNILGYVLFDCPPGSTYDVVKSRVKEALQIRVTNSKVVENIQ